MTKPFSNLPACGPPGVWSAMIVRCAARALTAVALTTLALSTGCVRRTTVSQDFGLPGAGRSQRTTRDAGAGSAGTGRQKAARPERSLRPILQPQTKGALNPLVDDPRVQALQTRSRLDPRDIAARLELAGIYENYRFYDDGLEQYMSVLRSAWSTPPTQGPSTEQAVLGLGRCAVGSGRILEAIPLLEEISRDWPSASAWNELGLLYEHLGDLAAGESAFQEAVARDAESGRLLNNLGYNLLLQNKLEAAEGEFRSALRLNPKSITTRNNLGVVLARCGASQSALEQFRLAADAATAHNNLAAVLLETGKYDESREQLVKSLMIRPYFAPALANFKLLQERIRERPASEGDPAAATAPSAGRSVPLAPDNRSPDW